jgi:hypothetical protein
MKKHFLSALLVFVVLASKSQTPTWSEDIASIVYANCTKCHHDGGLAPFSLMGYDDAVLFANNMSSSVSSGKMPPWPPDRNYQHYINERYLTNTEIIKINAWVSGGTPQGNPANAPAMPVYTNGSALGTVNLTGRIPSFTVPNINYDLYQCFVVPTGLTQDVFATGIEIIPGDPSIVHHVLVFEDTTGQGAVLDAATPEPGYTNFGGPGFNASMVSGWVPGTMPKIYPTGMGVKLHANSSLILQIHYPNGSAGRVDSTRINIRTSTGNLRNVFIQPILNHGTSLVNGPLSIPPNSTRVFTEAYTLPTNYPIPGISLVDVAPHAHLICRNWLVFAVQPSGDTVPLIKINDWDFHWQGFYAFRNLLKFNLGTRVYAKALYDNTLNNPHNPSNPPRQVNVGESTTDEMMLVYFSYLIYQNGDENIVLDSSTINVPTDLKEPISDNGIVSTVQLYDAYPNPSNGATTLSFYSPANHPVTLQITNLLGEKVDEMHIKAESGFNKFEYSNQRLQAGTYFYTISCNGINRSKQLVIE